ncbi:hypothetical protein HanRHA438_Chr15g0713781 [Helianthus annuus]|nr:hypothetical protein HanRHA438_Chr15g0713781 [Helianthus annuus]
MQECNETQSWTYDNFCKEAPKVYLEDYTTLLNINDLRDQATNHSLQRLYSTFKEDGHTSLK